MNLGDYPDYRDRKPYSWPAWEKMINQLNETARFYDESWLVFFREELHLLGSTQHGLVVSAGPVPLPSFGEIHLAYIPKDHFFASKLSEHIRRFITPFGGDLSPRCALCYLKVHYEPSTNSLLVIELHSLVNTEQYLHELYPSFFDTFEAHFSGKDGSGNRQGGFWVLINQLRNLAVEHKVQSVEWRRHVDQEKERAVMGAQAFLDVFSAKGGGFKVPKKRASKRDLVLVANRVAD